MDLNERARERQLRRQLVKAGCRLHKTPARHWLRKEYGPGYMITANNTVICGCTHREYELTLDQAAEASSAMIVAKI